MPSFIGRYDYSIDHKGRLNIPAKFRRNIDPESQETFVITLGLEGCLFAFPLSEWSLIEEKLRELPLTQKRTRFFVRTLTSHASDSRIDSQGRITVSQKLLELAGISKEVIIIGVLGRIEIWAPDRYESYQKDFGMSYEEVAEDILL